MSNLLAELAGISFAEQYNTVNVTGCKIKKEDMTMCVDLLSDAFPCELPFAKLRAAIRAKFGVSKITFNIKKGRRKNAKSKVEKSPCNVTLCN